jgi:hypothetical protein
MIKLADILRQYHDEFISAYGHRIHAVHHRAIHQILTCHTPACGEIHSHCSDCQRHNVHFCSCGHRFCPSCQHLANSDWLARQQQKLLPVDYYLISFTLPRQLRPFIWHHQKWAYKVLFDCAVATLQSFFARDNKLQGQAGLTAVLHTHARNLDFHPHIHLIVPAGSLNKRSRLWRQKTAVTCSAQRIWSRSFGLSSFTPWLWRNTPCPPKHLKNGMQIVSMWVRETVR